MATNWKKGRVFVASGTSHYGNIMIDEAGVLTIELAGETDGPIDRPDYTFSPNEWKFVEWD